MSLLPCPDSTDILLLNRLQEDFPLISEPWGRIARDIDVPVEELFMRISRLEDLGILRGITPVLESSRFGLKSGTLVAARILPEHRDEAVSIINSYSEVSHNYIRDHYYSVWFTIKARTGERIDEILSEIVEKTGIDNDDILNLPTVESYKTDVCFRCSGTENNGQKPAAGDKKITCELRG